MNYEQFIKENETCIKTKSIPGFSRYYMDNHGNVYNQKNDKKITAFRDQHGHMTVALYDSYLLQVRRNLFKLFCETWEINYDGKDRVIA